MDKPEVLLANSAAVYDFYRDHQQNRVLAKLAYATLSARYRPRIRYEDGAQDAIRELLALRTSIIIVANHLTHSDQYTLAATAWRTPLRQVIGRTRVLAKDELFVDPKVRRKVDLMGGIPVFRSKNYGLRAVADAGRCMMDISAERLSRGDNLAIFPEGTCNEVNPAQVQKINSGVGHIVSRAAKLGVEPALLAIGICYGPTTDVDMDVTSAVAYLGRPSRHLPVKSMDIARTVQSELQRAVDGAIAAY